ncbi:hypothetical protein HYS42_00070 [Candidatus Saccharibacteria bacterium]|nr:hypothetical protein [Candidatus Saccharibacteria bacterium]
MVEKVRIEEPDQRSIDEATRVARCLEYLRQARLNFSDQDLIEELVEQRKQVLGARIVSEEQTIARLRTELADDDGHRRVVKAVLSEEVRRAEGLASRISFLGS